MNKDSIEIRVAPCVVSKCKGELKAITVAARGEDIRVFDSYERHEKGVNEAVMARFLPQDYMVACYKELLRQY